MLPTLTVKQKIEHQQTLGSLPVATMHVPKDNVETRTLQPDVGGTEGVKERAAQEQDGETKVERYKGSKVKAKLDKIKC